MSDADWLIVRKTLSNNFLKTGNFQTKFPSFKIAVNCKCGATAKSSSAHGMKKGINLRYQVRGVNYLGIITET